MFEPVKEPGDTRPMRYLARAGVSIAAVFLALAWLAGLCCGAVVVGFQSGAGLPPRDQDSR